MQAVAFSPDSGQAATAARDGTWCVWDLSVRHWLQEDPKKLLQACSFATPLRSMRCLCAWARYRALSVQRHAVEQEGRGVPKRCAT